MKEKEEVYIPDLEEGQLLNLKELIPSQHFTKPPARYTEASLIKELEDKGIGRPSTYATILTTIQERNYVEKEKGHFRPTELGLLVQIYPARLTFLFGKLLKILGKVLSN